MVSKSVALDDLLKRVEALEKSSGGWESGTSSDGKIYWTRQIATGLLMQWSAGKCFPRNTTITLPKSYKSTTSYSCVAVQGLHANWSPVSSSGNAIIVSANQINVSSAEGSGGQFMFICIGY